MSPILRRWRLLALILAVLVAGTVLIALTRDDTPTVGVRDVGIDVVDGPAGAVEYVRIDATLYTPSDLPAPAVLLAHGFGGSKDSVADQARELAGRGFVVLAYSARGFGASTGQIALNSPDYEVTDARRLVDWLATRSEVRQDGPNDPRVGVTGSSYGGALALSLAGTDPRVDALVPLITWNDLSQALLPNAAATGSTVTPAAGSFGGSFGGGSASGSGGLTLGTADPATAAGVFKRSWAGVFFGAGLAPGADAGPRGEALEPGQEPDEAGLGGSASSGASSSASSGAGAGPVVGGSAGASPSLLQLGCGRFRPEVCAAYIQVATTGLATPEVVRLLQAASPAAVAGNITAPTMLVQGVQDTLFGLDQSDATARQIADAGGTVKVVWYNGGHDGGAPGQRLRNKIMDWFDHHLAGRGTDPGTDFEYAVSGSFQRDGLASVRTVYAPSYPGLDGDTPVQREELALRGGTQPVFAPPGGSPAAVSSVPGLGTLSSAAGAFGGVAVDVPGQSASFGTTVFDEQLLIVGAPQVTLEVAAIPGAPLRDAVLFAKLYDVAADGRRTLPGGGVAPLRVTGLPADGTPVEVTVALPGIVRPIEPGHRVEVVVSTTDQAYAMPAEPTAFTVAAAGALSVPLVPGRRAAGSGVPTAPLVGIGAVLGGVLLTAVVAVLRRRRSDDPRPDLVEVPLVIENLTKFYAGGFKAVDDLSFRVEPGQVLGLLGPNGAGKTTALRMLMGLIRPNAGEIRVFGRLVRPGDPVLSRLGAFVEGPGFLPHLSGIDNLRLYWAATGRPAADARMDEALEVAGLGVAVRRRVGTYSQGMRQRLAIAQAMLGLPDLLVLDEPTNGLDPPQIREMRDVLRRYAATGRTVLVSSHLLAEVEQTCSHVVVMHRGRLVAAGEVAEIVAGGGQASFRVGSPAEAAAVLGAASGITDVEVEGDQVHADLGGLPRSFAVAALVEAGVAVEQAGPRRRLEDAFLQLVGEEAVQ